MANGQDTIVRKIDLIDSVKTVKCLNIAEAIQIVNWIRRSGQGPMSYPGILHAGNVSRSKYSTYINFLFLHRSFHHSRCHVWLYSNDLLIRFLWIKRIQVAQSNGGGSPSVKGYSRSPVPIMRLHDKSILSKNFRSRSID